MIASFNKPSERISRGIWFAIVDEVPGFEGVADLLPTNRLRGFFAFVAGTDFFSLDSSVIVSGHVSAYSNNLDKDRISKISEWKVRSEAAADHVA